MKIYISGSISGNPHYEEDFNLMEKELAALKDIEPINPLKLDEISPDPEGCTPKEGWLHCMKRDIEAVVNCDAILMIEGAKPFHRSSNWKKSPGAQIERWAAKKYDIKIFYGWKNFARWYQKQHKYDVNVN